MTGLMQTPTPHTASPAPTAPLAQGAVATRPDIRRLLDAGERVAILILYAWLVWRFAGSLADKPGNVIFIVSEGLIAALVLMRRSTDQISIRPQDWIVGALGTALPMLIGPTEGGWAGGMVLLCAGFLISLGAKLSLRRSFGIVAANRGIKRSGLYAAVRHPMYLGYVIAYAGTLMVNPGWWNAAVLVAWFGFEIARIHAEERILMQDPAYRAHAEKVRYRLLPGVW